ncbi:hypothetical protein [Halococcus salsus]|uniref:hypothetical protein n=1 Tax=Halococcus salsus TaxID=2162894 RepID=UPI001358DA32|nr:hypothetical protein [Halococcus salsus]
MNHDVFAPTGRRITPTNTRSGTHADLDDGASRPTALVARLLVGLVLALAAVWLVAYALPAFGGLLAATVVGFVGLWAVPWLVVSGVVRAIEAGE